MFPAQSNRPRLLGTEFSPLAVYWLGGAADNVDRSGNGRNLTLDPAVTGAANYQIGRSGMRRSGVLGTRSDAAFRITGAISVIALVHVTATSTGGVIAACGVPGATAATNVLWALGLTNTTAAWLTYFAEFNTGSDVAYTIAGGHQPLGDWTAIGFTRNSAGTGVKIYQDGILQGTSGVLAAPNNGGSSVLGIGGYSDNNGPLSKPLDQIGIYGAELTAAQMAYLARRMLGPTS